MTNTDIYSELDALYKKSKERKRFFKGNGIVKIIKADPKPLKKIAKGNGVIRNFKEGDDEDKIIYQIRLEVEVEVEEDLEILFWDIYDHQWGLIKGFIGKRVNIKKVNSKNWSKSSFDITLIEDKIDKEAVLSVEVEQQKVKKETTDSSNTITQKSINKPLNNNNNKKKYIERVIELSNRREADKFAIELGKDKVIKLIEKKWNNVDQKTRLKICWLAWNFKSKCKNSDTLEEALSSFSSGEEDTIEDEIEEEIEKFTSEKNIIFEN